MGLECQPKCGSQEASNITVVKTKFLKNTANAGGAIIIQNGSRLNTTGCEFLQNIVQDYGGAVYAKDAYNLTISGGLFQSNYARQAGGGLAATIPSLKDDISFVEIANTTFVQNMAKTASLVKDSGLAAFDQQGKGGAIFFGDDFTNFGRPQNAIQGSLNVNIADSVNFTGNSASLGGAIACMRVEQLSIDFVNFPNNASVEGGAISFHSVNNSDPDIFNCTIEVMDRRP